MVETNSKYGFRKNQSMLEEERMKQEEKALRKFQGNTLEACQSTLGHAYSVYVEEIKMEHPNLNWFMEELNKHIFENHAYFKDSCEQFNSKKSHGLKMFLLNEIGRRRLSKESAKKIMQEIHPGVGYFGNSFEVDEILWKPMVD